jgi:type I restriction enzyme, S subunit
MIRIVTAFSRIDSLNVKALKLLGHFDQSILAKAFADDLVPQDPTDEPAETLVARIREARATAPKGKRRRLATTG